MTDIVSNPIRHTRRQTAPPRDVGDSSDVLIRRVNRAQTTISVQVETPIRANTIQALVILENYILIFHR